MATRYVPVEVRRQLRLEVGFCCPVPGCGNPYLEYHHFDPPFAGEPHQNPDGMIALCATHHAKADAFTVDQMRAMKRPDPNRPELKGTFEWMRDDILAVIGGNYHYEEPVAVAVNSQPAIWFRRDEDRNLLLNLRMPSAQTRERVSLEDNDWIIRGKPTDVESPPNGSYLKVSYSNGDKIAIRFRQWIDQDHFLKEHELRVAQIAEFQYPLVTAEISFEVGGTDIRFSPTGTTLHTNHITGMITMRNRRGGLNFMDARVRLAG